MTCRDSG